MKKSPRPTRWTAPTSYGYDAEGNLITVTDPMDNTTTYSYTADNELCTVTDALHGTTTYEYDLDDELTEVTDSDGYSVTYSYNDMGLGSGESRAGAERLGAIHEKPVATYTYNQDGDLTQGDRRRRPHHHLRLQRPERRDLGHQRRRRRDALHLRRRWRTS